MCIRDRRYSAHELCKKCSLNMVRYLKAHADNPLALPDVSLDIIYNVHIDLTFEDCRAPPTIESEKPYGFTFTYLQRFCLFCETYRNHIREIMIMGGNVNQIFRPLG